MSEGEKRQAERKHTLIYEGFSQVLKSIERLYDEANAGDFATFSDDALRRRLITLTTVDIGGQKRRVNYDRRNHDIVWVDVDQ